MELIKGFGIEPVSLIAQIFNFLVIFFILKRYAYKPVLTLLKKREETIKLGLQNAEKAQLLLEQAQDKEKTMLQQAQREARKMQDEAKEQAKALMDMMQKETKDKTERMLKEAKEQIERETKDAEKRLEKKTTEIAGVLVEKALTGFFDKKEQQTVTQQALKQMKKVS